MRSTWRNLRRPYEEGFIAEAYQVDLNRPDEHVEMPFEHYSGLLDMSDALTAGNASIKLTDLHHPDLSTFEAGAGIIVLASSAI